MAPKSEISFKFLKHANIGAADADQDQKFLSESFIDTGDLLILSDTSDPRSILLGRTGSGKTALINKLADTEEHVIKVYPDNLALTYISDSSIVRFFSDLGIKMDLFYRLLWRHIFTVEVLKDHFQITDESQKKEFLVKIQHLLQMRGQRQTTAVKYLLEWGESFWQETDYRVREVTTTLANDFRTSLKTEVQTSLPQLFTNSNTLDMESARAMSADQKAEVIRIGQTVVNKAQIQKLTEVIKLLNKHILTNSQKKYYITIDKLDENWIDDGLRYHLIVSLLETIRDFNNIVDNLKIIVAIREDLLDRAFRYARSAGHQEEKYKSMYLELRWQKSDLTKLIDQRVSQMIRSQYTKRRASLKDILPETIRSPNGKHSSIDYMLDRTMMRPRDIIMFFNECIKKAEGKAIISQTNIFNAEIEYSRSRLRALADEWHVEYSNLIDLAAFLRGCSSEFRFNDLDKSSIESTCVKLLIYNSSIKDEIYKISENIKGNIDDSIKKLIIILFKVGIIGVKTQNNMTFEWSYLGKKLREIEIADNTRFKVHPAFWQEFNIIIL